MLLLVWLVDQKHFILPCASLWSTDWTIINDIFFLFDLLKAGPTEMFLLYRFLFSESELVYVLVYAVILLLF